MFHQRLQVNFQARVLATSQLKSLLQVLHYLKNQLQLQQTVQHFLNLTLMLRQRHQCPRRFLQELLPHPRQAFPQCTNLYMRVNHVEQI